MMLADTLVWRKSLILNIYDKYDDMMGATAYIGLKILHVQEF